MFTGIIDHVAIVTTVRRQVQSYVLSIQSQLARLVLGESIAVDGVCLTVTSVDGTVFSCHVSPETSTLTNLSQLTEGAIVNVERALKVGDRLGGHFVTGHVDALVTVRLYQYCDACVVLILEGFTLAQMVYLTLKGSICVNGVSLTINDVNRLDRTVSLMLVPHTIKTTNLQYLKQGSRVNIEFDTMAKMVAHQLSVYQNWGVVDV